MAAFRKRGNKWEYRASYKDPFTQEYKVKSKGGFSTKKEAQMAAADAEKQIAEGLETTEGNISLSFYLNNWLVEYKKETVRKNTYDLHERNVRNHILPYFKNISLVDVKPIMYQKFLNHLTNQDYSKRTVEIIHGTMYNAMEKALVLGKLKKNPCRGATISNRNAKEDTGLKYMRSEDVPSFLQTAFKYNYIYYIFFKVLIESGMRKGEAAALQWTDIDLKENRISITKSLDFQADSEEGLFGDTKTYNSKREIVMSQSIMNELRDHKKWQNNNKLTLNDIYKHDLNLVFCRIDGNYLPKSTLFNAFKRILKQAELQQLPIHSLRHTHAVMLLESGSSMKFIQDRLGHGSMAITADVYSHVSDRLSKESIEEYEKYVSLFLK
ncbi:site-specific integrase [Domibacillus mangrovi]|uniref:Site-specific integrase n=1 Tax=Domibacillus mangrovi TaxID=1714354 RepID=A0A1Q5P448_9BACI|nr:site-specific integrase [Domibacillus mangrovi]OKL37035.1 site-specific integrase [Domibacillus mangrovi]